MYDPGEILEQDCTLFSLQASWKKENYMYFTPFLSIIASLVVTSYNGELKGSHY